MGLFERRTDMRTQWLLIGSLSLALFTVGCEKKEHAEQSGMTHEKAPAGDLWTCSMHPEVKQAKPGKCPTCTMDLVPMPSKGEAEPSGSGTMEPNGSEMKQNGD